MEILAIIYLILILIIGIVFSIINLRGKFINFWLISSWAGLAILYTAFLIADWRFSILFIAICIPNLIDISGNLKKKFGQNTEVLMVIHLATMLVATFVVGLFMKTNNSFLVVLGDLKEILLPYIVLFVLLGLIISIPFIIVRLWLNKRSGNSEPKPLPVVSIFVIPMLYIPAAIVLFLSDML